MFTLSKPPLPLNCLVTNANKLRAGKIKGAKNLKRMRHGKAAGRAAKLKRNLQGVIFYYPMKIMHFLKTLSLLHDFAFHGVPSRENYNILSSP